MSKEYSLIFFFLSLVWILLVHRVVGSQTSCPFPSKLKTFYDYNWQSRNNEWINTKKHKVVQIDYHYRSSSYNKKNRDGSEREIIVLNGDKHGNI